MAVSHLQINLNEIEPLRLYDTLFIAALAGLSAGSVRKVTAGFRDSPLIPRVTRLGVGTVRFSGRDILAWLEDPATASEQARLKFQAQLSSVPTSSVHASVPRRRPGRPSNRERDAARSAEERQ